MRGGLLLAAAPEVTTPRPMATPTSAATGASTSHVRRERRPNPRGRNRSRAGGSGSRSAISRTRSRSSGLAATAPARSSCTSASNRSSMTSGEDIAPHFLLELLKRPVQARRACGRADSQQPSGRLPVEVEEHPQSHDLALARREAPERRLERGREAVAEELALVDFGLEQGVRPLTTPAPRPPIGNGRGRSSVRAGEPRLRGRRGAGRTASSA